MPLDPQNFGYGDQVARPSPRASRLPLEGRLCQPVFTYAHLPTRWAWDGADDPDPKAKKAQRIGWLPALTALWHKPGVNGARAVQVPTDDDARPLWRVDMSEVFASFRSKKQATIIENHDPRLVTDGEHSYVAHHTTAEGRRHHDAIWVRYEALGKIVERTDNVAMRTDFLRRVVASYGLKMPLIVLKGRIALEDEQITRWGNAEGGNADLLKRKIKLALARREKMIDDWARQFNDGKRPDISAPPVVNLFADESGGGVAA